jgi:histidine triad (HIT) family protein
MDIHPIQSGQMLIIPKVEISTVWELPSIDYQALMASVQLAGKSLQRRFPEKKVGVMIEGLEITDHAHVIVFPFSNAAEYNAKPNINNPPTKLELEQLASELAF